MQNEFIIYNLHLRGGFSEIWQKSMVTTVKNHEKYGKNNILKSEIELKPLTSSERSDFSVCVG